MDWLYTHLLSWIIFLPTIGAGIILLLPNSRRDLVRTVALGSSLVAFVLSYLLFAGFSTDASFQFVERLP